MRGRKLAHTLTKALPSAQKRWSGVRVRRPHECITRQEEMDKGHDERKYSPGDPPNSANAGTTVLGGMTVLSAILAQSLIIVNFPWEQCQQATGRRQGCTHNDTVLPNLDMVPDGCCLDYRVRSDVDMVSYFHGVVVEVATIGLIRWSSHS